MYKRSNFEDFPDAKEAFERQTQANAGEDAGDVEADPAAEELESAYKEFDVCHWNRIVVRQDFDDCRMLLRDRDKEYRAELREKYRAVPDIIAMDHFAFEKKARVTRNLTKADNAYRDVVRRIRALGQYVGTCDSTNISNPSTYEGMWDVAEISRIKSFIGPGINHWLDGMPRRTPPSPSTPPPPPPPSFSRLPSDLASVQMMDSYSAIGGLNDVNLREAKRKRAHQRLVEDRARLYFAPRKRVKSASLDTSHAHKDQHKSKYRVVRAIPSETLGSVRQGSRRYLSGARRKQVPKEAAVYEQRRYYAQELTEVASNASVAEMP